MPATKFETKYQEGRDQEGKDVKKAEKCYQEAKCLGKLAIARLFFEKKISPDDKSKFTDIEYIESAIDRLYQIKEKDITEKLKKHAEFKFIEEELRKITKLENYLPKILAKANFLLATKITSNPAHVDQFQFLLRAGWYGEDQALVLLKAKTSKKISNDHVRKALIFFIKNKEGGDNKQNYILYLLVNLIIESNCKNTDLVKSSSLPIKIPEEELNSIKGYDFQDLPNELIRIAKKLVKPPVNHECFIKAVNKLIEKDAFDAESLTDSVDYLMKISEGVVLAGTEELMLLYCRMGEILSDSQEKYNQAVDLLEIGLKYLSKKHEKFISFNGIYQKLLPLTERVSALTNFTDKEAEAAKAEEFFTQAEALFSNNEKQKYVIQLYQKAAQLKNQKALKKLCDLYKEFEWKEKEEKNRKTVIPEIPAALSELLTQLPLSFIQAVYGNEIKNKKAAEKLAKKLEEEARESYEQLLKNHENGNSPTRIDIYTTMAELRHVGKIFKQNLHLARFLYEKAVNHGDITAFYPYAKMCFYGEGGEINLLEARKYVFCPEYEQENSIEIRYLKAEILYIDYLEAVDMKDTEKQDNCLQQCLELYRKNAIQGHEFSLYSLFIIFSYDKEQEAAKLLAELYAHGIKTVIPGIPVNLEDYDLYFYDQISERYINDAEIKNRLAIYRQNRNKENEKQELLLEQLVGKYQQAKTDKNEDELQKLDEKLNALAIDGLSKAALYYAEYQLLKNNPAPMRKFSGTPFHVQAVTFLTGYYKSILDTDIELKLLTALCYEVNRHLINEETKIREHNKCKLLVEVLEVLNPVFTNYEAPDFIRFLEENETKYKRFYDEYESDDSDLEVDSIYQAQDKHVTVDYPRIEELVERIAPKAKVELKKLSEAKFEDEKQYKDKVEAIKSFFLEATDGISFKSKRDKKKVEEDLATINYFSSQGKLCEGLRLVSTQFFLAQTRGIHFNVRAWNQLQRRKFWQFIKDKDHVLHDRPIFSFAVYDRAGVEDFTDLSETTYLRLEKIARYMHKRLVCLRKEDPYKTDSEVRLPESFNQYQFKSRNAQVQQLYSNEYHLFHEFLRSEILGENRVFISDKNPLVSTADIQSSHSERYAYGTKPYAGHEHERLRPKYNDEGRAIRPHSGAVFLTMHPLSDYARNDHNHVVSMCMTNQLIVDQRIIPERECSFYSFIQERRLIFIHKAKYPSFHHKEYPKVFLHLYGINPELYNLFKQLIKNTAPHEFKRRLGVLLLGEYLSAYQTLYLMRHAHERAERKELVLLYRDKYGNFSLRPTYDISPTPAGNDDQHRLRRYYTRTNRSLLFQSSSNVKKRQRSLSSTIGTNNLMDNNDDNDYLLQEPESKRSKLQPLSNLENRNRAINAVASRSEMVSDPTLEEPSVLIPSLVDMHWYVEEEINTLLQFYFHSQENKGIKLLTAILGTDWEAGNTLSAQLLQFNEQRKSYLAQGSPVENKVIIPVNLGTYNGEGGHWVLLFIKFSDNELQGKPQIVYFDPLGSSMHEEVRSALIGAGLSENEEQLKDQVICAQVKLQCDSYNCGPWIVAVADYLVTQEQNAQNSERVFNINEALLQLKELPINDIRVAQLQILKSQNSVNIQNTQSNEPYSGTIMDVDEVEVDEELDFDTEGNADITNLFPSPPGPFG